MLWILTSVLLLNQGFGAVLTVSAAEENASVQAAEDVLAEAGTIPEEAGIEEGAPTDNESGEFPQNETLDSDMEDSAPDAGKAAEQNTENDVAAVGGTESIVWGNYTAKKDDEAKILTLISYNGNESSITVPSKTTIEGTDYKVSLSYNTSTYESIWAGNDALTSISFNEGFQAPASCKALFAGCSNLTEINLTNFDTSQVTDMYCMFDSCKSLASLDVSKFNTSGVTNMSGMFIDCSRLESLDLSNFDTAGVTDMRNMFNNCSSLVSLDVSKFNTSGVTNMSGMFYYCKSLPSLDVSKFNTSGVTDMTLMFQGCTNLKSLNVSGFDTSQVTTMWGMFCGCIGLTSLDVSKFNTSKVSSMTDMFADCSSLTSLDLSTFNTSQVTEMYGMFSECSSLTSLNVSGFDTSQVTAMNGMFSGCSSLTSLDLSSFDTTRSCTTYNGTDFMLANTVSLNSIKTPRKTGRLKGIALYAKFSGGGYVDIEEIPAGLTQSILLTRSGGIAPGPEPTPAPVKETHTVTFMNGDTKVEEQTVEEGACAKEPANKPVKEGSTFLGWASGSTLWNFSMPIYSGLTLTAKFIENKPEAVSANTGSGKDAVPVITNGKVYLIKGQTYLAGGTNWTVRSGPAVVAIGKNTGKITAKKWGGAVVGNDDTTLSVNVAQPFFEKSGKTITLIVGETADIKKRKFFNINSPVSGVEEQYPITWEAANPKIAIINDGKVTALAKGATDIRAYVGGKTYTAKVKVLDRYTAPAKLYSFSSFTMNPLQTFTLKYDAAKTFKVNGATWSGNGIEPTLYTKGSKKGQPDGGYQNKIVSITKTGKLKAIGEGVTKLTGKDSQNREITLTVTVTPVSTKVNTFITKGKNETIKFPFVTNAKAVWTSSDTEVIPSSGTAAVERNFKKGTVKGEKVGSSLITCSFNGFRFSTLVYVEDPSFVTEGEGNKLTKNGNKYELKLKVGEIYNRVQMKDVYQTYLLKSSNAAVAFVDENGIVYARKKGKANITTTINGKRYQIGVIVAE